MMATLTVTATDHPKSKFITRNPNPSQLHQTLKLVILKGSDGKLVCGVKRRQDEQTTDHRNNESGKLRFSKRSKQVESVTNQVGITESSKFSSAAVQSSAKVEIVCALRAMPSNKSKTEPKKMDSSIGMQIPLPTPRVCETLRLSLDYKALRADMPKKRLADTLLKAPNQTLFAGNTKSEIVCALKAMPCNKAKPKPSEVPLPTPRTSCDLKEASKAGETLKHSPDHKTLRTEMPKKRFADTVMKAQNQMLFACAAERHDRLKVQLEKKRLERQEAEAKASTDQKMQRQREREAARMALQKMGESVEIEDNHSILTELAYMIGDFSFAGPLGGSGSMYVNRKLWRPLERFGLYLKEDHEDLIF